MIKEIDYNKYDKKNNTVIQLQEINQYKLIIKMGNCKSDPIGAENSNQNQQKTVKKRFNPFFQPNPQNNQQQIILNQYNFHSNYDDKFLGRCSILQHKETRNFYLSKQLQISSDQDYERKLKQFLQIQEKLNYQNIIQIKHIIEKQSDGFFSQNKKLIVIVDYPLTNLQKQFNSRIVNNLQFTRQQIINVLISCIKGYALIQRQQKQNQDIFKNDKIRLKNIFFGIKNRESLIKVAQSSLLTQKSNFECIFKDAYELPENRDIYLSPEQFKAFLQRQQNKYFQRSGVFSLGMSILDLCIMNSCRVAYHYEEQLMDFNQIRNRILIAGKKYGPIIERFLGDMLELDDRKRLSFNELQSKIPSLLLSRNTGDASRMNLSIARSGSVYLRNDHRSIRQSTSRSRESRSRSNSRNSRGSVNRGNISSNYSSMSVNSRYNSKLGRRMRGERQQGDQLDRVHQIYDKNIGRQYIGQKKGNMKHGQGRYQFEKDGPYYEGQWRNNKMEGRGETYFKEGEVQYSGEWKSDEYNGWGKLFTSSNLNSKWIFYEGQFKNGVKEGRGQMKFKNGIIYDGQFRGDKIHGRGKLIKQGKVFKDQFWELANPQTFLRDNQIQD